MAAAMNPYLHPRQAVQVWERLSGSRCGKVLGPVERNWMELFTAVAARDAERMAKARAFAPKGAVVSDFETRAGTRYTVDTLRALKARFPGVKFVWIMGADSLASFHRWRGWTQIMREVPVAVVSRPWIALRSRFSPAARRFARYRLPGPQARRVAGSTPPAWVFLTAPLNFQSSTALRERLRRTDA